MLEIHPASPPSTLFISNIIITKAKISSKHNHHHSFHHHPIHPHFLTHRVYHPISCGLATSVTMDGHVRNCHNPHVGRETIKLSKRTPTECPSQELPLLRIAVNSSSSVASLALSHKAANTKFMSLSGSTSFLGLDR